MTNNNDLKIKIPKEPKFHVPEEDNIYCNHEWKLILYDKHTKPMLGVGMCVKCAELQGGWAQND